MLKSLSENRFLKNIFEIIFFEKNLATFYKEIWKTLFENSFGKSPKK